MRTRSLAFVSLVCVVGAAQAQQPQQPTDTTKVTAQARADLDAIEAEAGKLTKGANDAGNALLQRCHRVRQALFATAGRADDAWATQLKRCEALDRQVQATCTGQPKPAPEPDAPTKQAHAKLDEVETALRTLAPGDGPAAIALVKVVDEAKSLLMGAQGRAADRWIDGLARSIAMDARIRARHAERAAAAPPPADEGPPKTGERPPAAARGLSATDGWTLRRDFYPAWDDVAAQVERGDTADFGLSTYAERLRDGVKRMLAAIKAVGEQQHADVLWCRRRLAALNERLEARIREGVAIQQARRTDAAAAVADVNSRLVALQAHFDPRTFTCHLGEPFTRRRVEAWVEDMKRWRDIARAGQAEMESIRTRYPGLAKDRAVEEMHGRFSRWLPGAIDTGLTRTTGRLRELLERGEYDAKGGIREEDLGNDSWVTGIVDRVRQGVVGGECLQVVARGYQGKDDPALAPRVERLRAFLADVEARGLRILQGQRMPAAASTDARLERQAREVLADPSCGAGELVRVVLLSTPSRQQERKTDSWTDSNYVYIRTWTEVWEEYQVATAEKHGDVHRIVTYTLKYVHRSSGMKPEGRWYCHDRFEGPRILPENVAR